MDAAAKVGTAASAPRPDTPSAKPDAPPKPPGRQIVAVDSQPLRGRVDAIADGRALGWAWHAGLPDERLRIDVLAAGRVIASVTAEQARIDLKRNGVGDGSHAFDFALPAGYADDAGRLEFRAVASTGETLLLHVASNDERAAEAAVAVPLARVLERLDMLLTVQRQMAIGQRDTLNTTKALTERVSALSAEGGTLDAAVARVAESQGDLTGRVEAIEVFLTRFDSTLAGFDKRLLALQTIGKHEVKPIVIMLATILGFIAGVVLMAFVP
jgi:hypothetical protein